MKVQVYRNLHKKCYSVRYKGKVIAHVDEITLLAARFKVGLKARQTVLEKRQKNVHAFVEGIVTMQEHELIHPVVYDPYVACYFFHEWMKTPIRYAGVAHLKGSRVFV